MKILKINLKKNSEKEVAILADCYRRGEVAVHPTDTIYGLGCRADAQKAVEKIYAIKKRPPEKGFIVLVSGLKMARQYSKINLKQAEIIKKYVQNKKGRPITFILSTRELLSFEKRIKGGDWMSYHRSDQGTAGVQSGIAIRIPKSRFLLELIARIKKPIVSTSLNISGQKNLEDLENIEKYYEKIKPDLIFDAGPIKNKKASKIIDIRDLENIKILRK